MSLLLSNATITVVRAGLVILGSPAPLRAMLTSPRPVDLASVIGTARYRCLLEFAYLRQINTSDYVAIQTWNGIAWGGRTYSVLDVAASGGLGLELAVLLIGDKSAQTG